MIRGEADGTISEAAAARPTVPSGAENQDNFIVIISLPLSPSLQLMEEEEEWRGKSRERECVAERGGEEGDRKKTHKRGNVGLMLGLMQNVCMCGMESVSLD